MKRLLVILLLLIILPATVARATVTYTADVTVSNNTSTAYTQLGVIGSENVTLLQSNGFITSTGLDTRVQNSGSDLPYMLASDRVTFSVPVPANSSNVYQFVTGQTAASSFQVVLGYGGYVTTNDTAALELANNGTIQMIPYLDTTAGGNKYIVRKQDALYGFVSLNVTGNITFQIVTSNETLWPDGAGDETGITNLVGAATHWQAESDNSTGSFVYTSNTSYERDLYTIGNPAGADVIRDVTVYLRYGTSVPANPAYIKAAWKIGGTVYLGSENFNTANETLLTQEYTTSPATGNPWTIAELTAAQLGASLHADGGATAQLYDEYAVIHYVRQVSVSGISSGKRTITPHLDGTNFWLTVDGSASTNVTAPTVPDNGNPYIFGSNAVAYFDSIKLTKGGNEKLWYQPITIVTSSQLTDRDGTKNGDITWGTNPSGVSVTFGGLTSTTVITANTTSSNYVGNFLPTAVHPSTSPTLGEAETAVESDWLYLFIKPFAGTSGTQAVWFYWFGTILFGVLGFVFAYRTKHLLISAIAFDIPFGYGIAKGYVPEWVIPILVLWTIGAVIAEAKM